MVGARRASRRVSRRSLPRSSESAQCDASLRGHSEHWELALVQLSVTAAVTSVLNPRDAAFWVPLWPVTTLDSKLLGSALAKQLAVVNPYVPALPHLPRRARRWHV